MPAPNMQFATSGGATHSRQSNDILSLIIINITP